LEKAMTLDEMKNGWLNATDEEAYDFVAFPNEPMKLRRSKTEPSVLSSLVFGTYKGFDGRWIENDRVIWLAMIVSEERGGAGEWIRKVARQYGDCGFTIIGSPVYMRPKGFGVDRPSMTDQRLTFWYIKQGFSVAQSSKDTLVCRPGAGAKIDLSLNIR
jgi:hypothetical protein